MNVSILPQYRCDVKPMWGLRNARRQLFYKNEHSRQTIANFYFVAKDLFTSCLSYYPKKESSSVRKHALQHAARKKNKALLIPSKAWLIAWKQLNTRAQSKGLRYHTTPKCSSVRKSYQCDELWPQTSVTSFTVRSGLFIQYERMTIIWNNMFDNMYMKNNGHTMKIWMKINFWKNIEWLLSDVKNIYTLPQINPSYTRHPRENTTTAGHRGRPKFHSQ
jgi:hypothetical protein